MCGFNEATLQLFIDDDADAEFAELENYVPEISVVESRATWDTF